MAGWSEQEFLERMEQDSSFTSEAIAVSQSILDWASTNKRVSTSWSGTKVPIFNASASGKRFISISARKGWDVEIPFLSYEGYLLKPAKSQEAIDRLEQMRITTAHPQGLSTEHRRAIRLHSIQPHLEQFLELLNWLVDEIYAENQLI